MADAAKAAVEPASSKPERKIPEKKKRGCLRSCLLAFVILLLAAGGVIAGALGLPRKWGLVKSSTERIFDVDNTDRYAASDIEAELEASGVATAGMDVYVLPRRDGQGAAAYVTLDASDGFSFSPKAGEEDPLLGTFAAFSRAAAAKGGAVSYAAFEYKDPKGRTLVTIGASIKDGIDYADGKISREQFAERIGGTTDLKNLVDVQLEVLQ
jgi:hypothetical protein